MNKDEFDKITNRVDSELELKVVASSITKNTLALIPIIGHSINGFIDIRNQIQQERLNALVLILNSRMEKVEASLIDQDYLKGDDFFDYTQAMLESSIKIRTEEKRRALVNIYVNSILNKSDYLNDESKLFLDYITHLSLAQILILKFVLNNKKKLVEIGSYDSLHKLYCLTFPEPHIDSDNFKFYCSDLEKRALVSFGDGLDDFNSQAAYKVAESHKESSAVITEMGNRFMEFLQVKNGI